jgi:hypothetical protein
MPTTKRRRTAQPQTFEFEYQGKRYIIRSRYEGQHATLYTTDGQILHVRTWKLGVPFSPEPYQVETFDPQQQTAAELAAAAESGFVAELQAGENGTAATQA